MSGRHRAVTVLDVLDGSAAPVTAHRPPFRLPVDPVLAVAVHKVIVLVIRIHPAIRTDPEGALCEVKEPNRGTGRTQARPTIRTLQLLVVPVLLLHRLLLEPHLARPADAVYEPVPPNDLRSGVEPAATAEISLLLSRTPWGSRPAMRGATPKRSNLKCHGGTDPRP